MWSRWLFSLLVLVINWSQALAKSSSGDSVLVMIDPKAQKDYSVFFDGLKKSGYELTYRGPKDESPEIIKDDIPSFSHIIMFASDVKNYAKDLSPQNLVTAASTGTNLLIALSSKQTTMSSLAAEFGIILPPPGTPLISYFPERKEEPTVIPIHPSSSPDSPVLSKDLQAPVWYSGIGFALSNNPLLVPLLNAPAEAFCADAPADSGADAVVDAAEKGGEGLWAGSSLAVATGFQTLHNTRVAFVGGVDLFGDAFAKKSGSGNKEVARDVAAWTFRESSVLRIDSTEHTHAFANASSPGTPAPADPLEESASTPAPPDRYTTNDMIVYTAHISRYEPKSGEWVPYSGLEDLQLEFTMLDPFVRTALLPVAGEPGKYSVTFRAPDRHGVFKFVINYKRKGSTTLFSSTTVAVVPPRHDGYPRFLSAAWPYYTGAISTSAAFFIFSALWLGGGARDVKKKKAE